MITLLKKIIPVPVKEFIKKIVFSINPRRYSKYDNHHPVHWLWYENKDHWYPKVVDQSVGFFTEPGLVLDLGSGDGLVSSLFVEKGFSVVGIEPEKDGVEISRTKVPGGTFLQTTFKDFVNNPPHSLDIQYDYLYSLNTIEHIKEYKLIPEFIMERVKKFAIIITDDASVATTAGAFHWKEFTIEELEDLFIDFRTERLDIVTGPFIGLKIYAN